MISKIKESDIKQYYFFDNMINIKSFNPDKIKIDENSCKCILIYDIEYVTIKDISYAKINSVNPLYLIIDKINEYIEKSTLNKYLTLVPNAESKDMLKKYKNYRIRSGI